MEFMQAIGESLAAMSETMATVQIVVAAMAGGLLVHLWQHPK